jgi:hypothetical protein
MKNKTNLKGWQFESGLPDEYDFYIQRAYFGYLDEYMGGDQLLLIMEGSSPTENVDRIIWACGKGWRAGRGGAIAEHDTRKRFVAATIIAKMMARVVGELGVDLPSKGDMTGARIWGTNGELGFHMRREVIEHGPGIEPTEHIMPVAVLESTQKAANTEIKIPDELAKILTDIAKAAPDNNTFLKKALAIPEIRSSDEMANMVMDANFYTKLKNS